MPSSPPPPRACRPAGRPRRNNATRLATGIMVRPDRIWSLILRLLATSPRSCPILRRRSHLDLVPSSSKGRQRCAKASAHMHAAGRTYLSPWDARHLPLLRASRTDKVWYVVFSRPPMESGNPSLFRRGDAARWGHGLVPRAD